MVFCGCGLDVVDTILEPPLSDGHTALYSLDDYTSKYFSFMSFENSPNVSSSVFKFKGTAVYYKIFNNYSTMQSCQNAVSSLNTDTNYMSAVELMTETQKYKTLKLSTGSISPLIKAVGANQYVYIRLTDYGTTAAYKQGISVGNASMKEYKETAALTYDGTIVYPRRSINSAYTFNFGGGNAETDKVPLSTDDDVYWSDTTSVAKTWYVDMYAVSVGLETDTWTYSYSQVLHLGSVSIVEGGAN